MNGHLVQRHLTWLLAPLLLLGAAMTCSAQSSLSPEQRDEVLRMIAQDREKTREEIRREVVAELAAKADADANADGSSQETQVEPLPSIETGSQNAASAAFFKGQGGDSLYDRDASSGKSGFQIVAGSDASRASVRWGRDVSGRQKGIFTSETLTASAPLDKKDPKSTNLVTLDGLTSGFELAYNFSRYRMNGLVSPLGPDGRPLPRVLEICKISGAAQCDEESVANGLKEKGRLELLPEFSAYFEQPNFKDSVFGFKMRVGYENFEFYETPVLAKDTRSEIPWGVGAYYGLVLPRQRMFLSASAEVQQSYKAATAVTACPLPGTAGFVKCVTGSLAPPQSKQKQLLSFEARREIESLGPLGHDIGVSLKLVHDFKNDETSVDLPVYLFRSDKNLLNGGFRIGWSSTDQFNAAIFVGSDFNVITR
jgi:hypothetical protein